MVAGPNDGVCSGEHGPERLEVVGAQRVEAGVSASLKRSVVNIKNKSFSVTAELDVPEGAPKA